MQELFDAEMRDPIMGRARVFLKDPDKVAEKIDEDELNIALDDFWQYVECEELKKLVDERIIGIDCYHAEYGPLITYDEVEVLTWVIDDEAFNKFLISEYPGKEIDDSLIRIALNDLAECMADAIREFDV